MIVIPSKVRSSRTFPPVVRRTFRLGDDERDRKRKIFSARTSASKEKSSTMLLSHEGTEASLNTAQDFKILLRPKKKNGFKLIKSKSKVPSEQKERRSSKATTAAEPSQRIESDRSFRFERRKTQIEIESGQCRQPVRFSWATAWYSGSLVGRSDQTKSTRQWRFSCTEIPRWLHSYHRSR